MESSASSKKKEGPVSIFFSYSHKDEELRHQLEKHLSIFKRENQIEPWHDGKIGPGEEWEGEINKYLQNADIILLLISPDFVASDYCWDIEMKYAVEMHRKGATKTIPILLRPVAGWYETALGKLQAIPRDSKWVTTEWTDIDNAFTNIANEIKELLKSLKPVTRANPSLVKWTLHVEGEENSFGKEKIGKLIIKLRKLVKNFDIDFIELVDGSVGLKFESTEESYDTIKELHDKGHLSEKLDLVILGLSKDIGTCLRIESCIVKDEIKTSIKYLPGIFINGDKGFPPLIGEMAISQSNPFQMGLSLLSDPSHTELSNIEKLELQHRLGRYLNTFLVLTGDNINVSLSPKEENCGVPKLLQQTELGRELLAQDVMLKYFTAMLLYPESDTGRKFWSKIDKVGDLENGFESCIRVWIVPGKATVSEKSEKGYINVKLEKFRLNVLCDTDYKAIELQSGGRVNYQAKEFLHNTILNKFKEVILPKIQEEVDLGAKFGILRQIYSTMIMAKWIMNSPFVPYLKKCGFMESNDPQKFNLNVVNDDVLNLMIRQYKEMFDNGIWSYTFMNYDENTNELKKRLFVVGGIETISE